MVYEYEFNLIFLITSSIIHLGQPGADGKDGKDGKDGQNGFAGPPGKRFISLKYK